MDSDESISKINELRQEAIIRHGIEMSKINDLEAEITGDKGISLEDGLDRVKEAIKTAKHAV